MNRKALIVVDMQKDFIDGSLGTKEAQEIVPSVVSFIRSFDGDVIYTRDTHHENYLETSEGKKLPVVHCVSNTPGWEIQPDVLSAGQDKTIAIFDKPTFGSVALQKYIQVRNYEDITLIGLCTDICVISNAMLIKAICPESQIKVISSCCAGVTPESHQNALSAMKMCQIDVL